MDQFKKKFNTQIFSIKKVGKQFIDSITKSFKERNKGEEENEETNKQQQKMKTKKTQYDFSSRHFEVGLLEYSHFQGSLASFPILRYTFQIFSRTNLFLSPPDVATVQGILIKHLQR